VATEGTTRRARRVARCEKHAQRRVRLVVLVSYSFCKGIFSSTVVMCFVHFVVQCSD